MYQIKHHREKAMELNHPEHKITDYIGSLLRQIKILNMDYEDGQVTSEEYETEMNELCNAIHNAPDISG
jgi:hypothetical protein